MKCRAMQTASRPRFASTFHKGEGGNTVLARMKKRFNQIHHSFNLASIR
jgi:hypothetical protein